MDFSINVLDVVPLIWAILGYINECQYGGYTYDFQNRCVANEMNVIDILTILNHIQDPLESVCTHSQTPNRNERIMDWLHQNQEITRTTNFEPILNEIRKITNVQAVIEDARMYSSNVEVKIKEMGVAIRHAGSITKPRNNITHAATMQHTSKMQDRSAVIGHPQKTYEELYALGCITSYGTVESYCDFTLSDTVPTWSNESPLPKTGIPVSTITLSAMRSRRSMLKRSIESLLTERDAQYTFRPEGFLGTSGECYFVARDPAFTSPVMQGFLPFIPEVNGAAHIRPVSQHAAASRECHMLVHDGKSKLGSFPIHLSTIQRTNSVRIRRFVNHLTRPNRMQLLLSNLPCALDEQTPLAAQLIEYMQSLDLNPSMLKPPINIDDMHALGDNALGTSAITTLRQWSFSTMTPTCSGSYEFVDSSDVDNNVYVDYPIHVRDRAIDQHADIRDEAEDAFQSLIESANTILHSHAVVSTSLTNRAIRTAYDKIGAIIATHFQSRYKQTIRALHEYMDEQVARIPELASVQQSQYSELEYQAHGSMVSYMLHGITVGISNFLGLQSDAEFQEVLASVIIPFAEGYGESIFQMSKLIVKRAPNALRIVQRTAPKVARSAIRPLSAVFVKISGGAIQTPMVSPTKLYSSSMTRSVIPSHVGSVGKKTVDAVSDAVFEANPATLAALRSRQVKLNVLIDGPAMVHPPAKYMNVGSAKKRLIAAFKENALGIEFVPDQARVGTSKFSLPDPNDARTAVMGTTDAALMRQKAQQMAFQQVDIPSPGKAFDALSRFSKIQKVFKKTISTVFEVFPLVDIVLTATDIHSKVSAVIGMNPLILSVAGQLHYALLIVDIAVDVLNLGLAIVLSVALVVKVVTLTVVVGTLKSIGLYAVFAGINAFAASAAATGIGIVLALVSIIIQVVVVLVTTFLLPQKCTMINDHIISNYCMTCSRSSVAYPVYSEKIPSTMYGQTECVPEYRSWNGAAWSTFDACRDYWGFEALGWEQNNEPEACYDDNYISGYKYLCNIALYKGTAITTEYAHLNCAADESYTATSGSVCGFYDELYMFYDEGVRILDGPTSHNMACCILPANGSMITSSVAHSNAEIVWPDSNARYAHDLGFCKSNIVREFARKLGVSPTKFDCNFRCSSYRDPDYRCDNVFHSRYSEGNAYDYYFNKDTMENRQMFLVQGPDCECSGHYWLIEQESRTFRDNVRSFESPIAWPYTTIRFGMSPGFCLSLFGENDVRMGNCYTSGDGHTWNAIYSFQLTTTAGDCLEPIEYPQHLGRLVIRQCSYVSHYQWNWSDGELRNREHTNLCLRPVELPVSYNTKVHLVYCN